MNGWMGFVREELDAFCYVVLHLRCLVVCVLGGGFCVLEVGIDDVGEVIGGGVGVNGRCGGRQS